MSRELPPLKNIPSMVADMFETTLGDPHIEAFTDDKSFVVFDYKNCPPGKLKEHPVPLYTVELISASSPHELNYEIANKKNNMDLRKTNSLFYPSKISSDSTITYQSHWSGLLDRVTLIGIEQSLFEEEYKEQTGATSINLESKIIDIHSNQIILGHIAALRNEIKGETQKNIRYLRKTIELLIYDLVYEIVKDNPSNLNPERLLFEKAVKFIKYNSSMKLEVQHVLDELNSDFSVYPWVTYQMLEKIFNKFSSLRMGPQSFIFHERLQYINRCLSKGVKAAELARMFEMTDSNFSRHYKALRRDEVVTPAMMSKWINFLDSYKDKLLSADIKKQDVLEKGKFKRLDDVDAAMRLKFGKSFDEFCQDKLL